MEEIFKIVLGIVIGLTLCIILTFLLQGGIDNTTDKVEIIETKKDK